MSVAVAADWLSKNVANDPVGDVPVQLFTLLGPGAAFANATVSSYDGFVNATGVESGVVAEKMVVFAEQTTGVHPCPACTSANRPSTRAPMLCAAAGEAP